MARFTFSRSCALIAITAAAISACAGPSQPGASGEAPAPPTAAEAERACSRLQEVVAQEPSGFQELRAAKGTERGMTVWQTQPVFATGECLIMEWAADRVTYSCRWNHDGEEAARIRYTQYAPVVAECLGEGWTRSARDTRTGQLTGFTGPGGTHVYLLYFKPSGGFSRSWRTTLVVGNDPSLEP